MEAAIKIAPILSLLELPLLEPVEQPFVHAAITFVRLVSKRAVLTIIQTETMLITYFQLRLDFNTFVITGPSTQTDSQLKTLNGSPNAGGESATTSTRCLTDIFSGLS